MKHSTAKLFTFLITLISLAASNTFAAEIYKWVDKDGKVHYSERKPMGAKEKAIDIKIATPPPQTVRSEATTLNGSPAVSGATAGTKNKEEPGESSPNKPPKSLSGGRIDETKESKCNLARDVLSGAVRHGNGARTDAYDRQIAENDIRLFCK